MPVELAFSEPSMFVVHASGDVTFREWETIIDELLEHPQLRGGVGVLVDGRSVSGAPSTDELRTIARDLKPLLDRGLGPVAIVTDSAFLYGVARMFSVFAEWSNANVAAFRDMDAAREWLATQTPHVS